MNKGVSLNELIIIVVVVALLSAIAVPQYFKMLEKTKAKEGQMTLLFLRDFQLRYYAENNKFTNNLNDLGLTPADLNLKYFNSVGVAAPAKAPANQIAFLSRDRSVHNGPADYSLAVQVDGKVVCTTSEDVCAVSGFYYQP